MQSVFNRNILVFALGLIAAFWIAAVALAADIQYEINSVYDVPKEGASTITHVVDVTNKTGENAPTEYVFKAVGTDLEEISATTKNNDKLKTNYESSSESISVTIPSNVGGKNKNWSFSLSYESQLLADFGETKVVQIPTDNLGGLNITSQSVKVTADLDLGFATTRGPEPDSTDISVGKQVVNYTNKKGSIDHSATLLFGEKSVVDVDIGVTLINNSWWWNTVEFSLPPDTNQQKVINRINRAGAKGSSIG